MWKRMTEEEIKDKDLKSGKTDMIRLAKLFVSSFTLILLVLVLLNKIGVNLDSGRMVLTPRSWEDIVAKLTVLIVISLVMAVGISVGLVMKSWRRDEWMCMKCEHMIYSDTPVTRRCRCGGQFERLSNLKWVDEPDPK